MPRLFFCLVAASLLFVPACNLRPKVEKYGNRKAEDKGGAAQGKEPDYTQKPDDLTSKKSPQEPPQPTVDSSTISYGSFDTMRAIITNSGTRLEGKPKMSGGPLIYSSYPEYIKTAGYIRRETMDKVSRFRFFMYHVNTMTVAHYIGFAIRNLADEPIDIYVSRRGYKIGTDNNPALVGRDAQAMWYSLADGKDYYVGGAEVGGTWYSTQPAALGNNFPTRTIGTRNGLVQGMYDIAVVGRTSKGAVKYEVVSYASKAQVPGIDGLAAATGQHGANVLCPHSVLTFDFAVDFTADNHSRYFDVYPADGGDKFCKVLAGTAGAYGNYGVDYVVNYQFKNLKEKFVHVAAIAPVGSGNQYYAGKVRHHSGNHTGKSSVLKTNVNGKNVDEGRELAILTGAGSVSVETQLTGGNYAPLRIYTWNWME